MAYAGAIAAGAAVISAIVGMQRGDGGLSNVLAAINVQLDGLIRAQKLSFDALRRIGYSLEEMHKEVSTLDVKMAQTQFAYRIAGYCRNLGEELQLIANSPDHRHAEIVERVETVVAELRIEIDTLYGTSTAGRFNAVPYFAAGNALAMAQTIRRFLTSKGLYGTGVSDHIPFIEEDAVRILEDYVSPGEGVHKEIRQIKERIYRITGALRSSPPILLDKSLWKASIDEFTDLTDANSKRPKIWPWSLTKKDMAVVVQETKIHVPTGRFIRTLQDKRRLTSMGREGHDHWVGYQLELYADTIYTFDVNTRVTSIGGKSTLIEFERVNLKESKTSNWEFHYRDEVSGRGSRRTWEAGNEPLKFFGRERDEYIAPKMAIADFNRIQDELDGILKERNSLAVLLAFYIQIRDGAQRVLESYQARGAE